MNTCSPINAPASKSPLQSIFTFARLAAIAIAATSLLAVSSTAAKGESATGAPKSVHDSDIVLREGDTIKVSFPGAPDMNPDSALEIRPDGKITLPVVGEVMAAGKTPAELQKDLLALYAGQLQTKEVVVTVVSSSFSVFVDGAVMHSGKIVSNHPLTILEAVMEAGGFDYNKANTEKVTVIRKNAGSSNYTYFTLNIRNVLNGKDNEAFYLQAGDMVHVPERFSWY